MLPDRIRRRRPWRESTLPLAGRDVWIVVLNWNRRDETLACLASLAHAALDGATVVVVDNGSRDGTVDAVRAAYPAVRVVALGENRGFAGGCNAGIRAALDAGAGAVLLLNNDTEVAPDFLAPLLEVMNHMPRAAAVAGAVFRADSPEVLDVAWLDIYFGHGIVRRRGVNALPGEGYDQVRRISAGVGSFLLLRATALRHVGLLDEAYFAYHEEVDWCYRAQRAGYVIVYQPYARVWHRGSRSTADLSRPPARRWRADRPQLPNPIPLSWNPVRTYLGARNSVRFVRRHGTWWHKLYFVASSLYAIPLDLLAVTMGREEEVKLGLWTYRRALALYCLENELRDGERPTWRTYVRALLHAPRHLVVSLPADVRRAHAAGMTVEVVECLRGLRDGYYERPLPLERLGLR
ncbi:MAG TPA: glycosyltransferase family 2 protein [Candidatus Limnocylindria bacterium]|nr:glycosyltransferase family 2 protein [Candidatus Limnocylindria bacterium]